MMKGFITTALLLILSGLVHAQPCTTPGQTPSTALPVCGTTIFNQTTVPICGTQSLGVPGCSGAAYSDKNPFWYKFTCFQSGTLGFLIQPVNPGDDYDWQLYDITNRDPNEVYTNINLVVTGNWAGTFGNTGASPSGVNFIQCASDPAANLNSFSTMPNLIQGHTYL
ncbi:MAG TPA: PKD domain-containing protein, partial [Flavisolibacter sp.]